MSTEHNKPLESVGEAELMSKVLKITNQLFDDRSERVVQIAGKNYLGLFPKLDDEWSELPNWQFKTPNTLIVRAGESAVLANTDFGNDAEVYSFVMNGQLDITRRKWQAGKHNQDPVLQAEEKYVLLDGLARELERPDSMSDQHAEELTRRFVIIERNNQDPLN